MKKYKVTLLFVGLILMLMLIAFQPYSKLENSKVVKYDSSCITALEKFSYETDTKSSYSEYLYTVIVDAHTLVFKRYKIEDKAELKIDVQKGKQLIFSFIAGTPSNWDFYMDKADFAHFGRSYYLYPHVSQKSNSTFIPAMKRNNYSFIANKKGTERITFFMTGYSHVLLKKFSVNLTVK